MPVDDFLVSKRSNLASLFAPHGHTSTAEKPASSGPTNKRIPGDARQVSSGLDSATAPKLDLIILKQVHAFKLISNKYEALGKLGMALLGCKTPPVYQLLLYKTKDEIVCKVKITSNFVFSIVDHNYASFYCSELNNFSVVFDSSDELKEFALQLVLLKACCEPIIKLLTQDVVFGTGPVIEEDREAEVTMTYSQLLDLSVTLLRENEKRTVDTQKTEEKWFEGLLGMKLGGRRAIVVPRDMAGDLADNISSSASLVIEVEYPVRIPVEPESVLESSAEESNVKQKKSFLDDSISGQSHKAMLLSRVARIGHATLPLRGAVAAEPSDSEEDSSPSPKPRSRRPVENVVQPNFKPLVSKTKPVQSMYQPIVPPVAQPVAIYQPSFPSNMIAGGYSTMLPPQSDANLSMHFAESRTQTMELRMGISKVTEKIDLVLNKMEDLKVPSQQVASSPVGVMDPNSLLTSIQMLVNDNIKLKDRVEEQRMKIETQNDRIYHLLELNAKSMEQTSSNVKLQSASEIKLLSDLNETKTYEKNLREELGRVTDRLRSLEQELILKEENIKVIQEENSKISAKLNLCETNYSNNVKILEEKLKVSEELHVSVSAIKETLSSNLKAVESEKQELLDKVSALQSEVEQNKESIEDLVTNKQTLLSQLEHLQSIKSTDAEVDKQKSYFEDKCKKLAAENEKLLIKLAEQEQIDEHIKREENLRECQEQNKVLISNNNELVFRLENLKQDLDKGNEENVKKLMNHLYRIFQNAFRRDNQYEGDIVLDTVANGIRQTTLAFLELQRTVGSQNDSPPRECFNAESVTVLESKHSNGDGISSNSELSTLKVSETMPLNYSKVSAEVSEEDSGSFINSKTAVSATSYSSFDNGNSPPSSESSPVGAFTEDALVTSESKGEEECRESLEDPQSPSIEVAKTIEPPIKHSPYFDTKPPPVPLFDDDDDEEEALW